MFCRSCGSDVRDDYQICPNCGAKMFENGMNNRSSDIKTTGILVFSIIELVCCNPLFGLIALILYFVQLRAAVNNGDINGAKKSKKLITILLIIGATLTLLLYGFLILVPNFSGIQGRMQVRADMATASQVGKATSIWYTEAVNGAYEYKNVENSFVRLDEIDGMNDYVDTSLVPSSYGDSRSEGAYYVTVVGEDEGIKGSVVVAIGPKNLNNAMGDNYVSETFFQELEEPIIVDYTGVNSGIAYVEP